jgi:glycosyltransferase involved in cell wall biosynthesis
LKHIYFTVTNDLAFDQRMHRICTSLAQQGYRVTLIGRKLRHSPALPQRPFEQKRIRCLFNKGFLFYAEYNTRLLFHLLFRKMDAVCAIDLDTILPCLFVSKIKNVRRIYDAHEYFTELKEVRTRPRVKKIWTLIERYALPRFKHGYTVSEGLAAEFERNYGVRYAVIRNLPVLKPLPEVKSPEHFLLYQGVVNEGRGFEYLIPAMKQVPCKLVICGDGNFMPQLKELIRQNGVQDRIELKGMLPPEELLPIAATATLGLALAEKEGINQYLALPNKFFDYLHAGLPQLTMNYPEYARINSEYKVAILLDKLSTDHIALAITNALNNPPLLAELRSNCLHARTILNWQQEEQKLISFYEELNHEGAKAR